MSSRGETVMAKMSENMEGLLWRGVWGVLFNGGHGIVDVESLQFGGGRAKQGG